MGLESGTVISDLNSSWPLSTDQRRYGAPHLRLIKYTLQNTFPNINAPIVLTDEELNQFVGFSVSAINALTLSGQLAAFYRDASNLNAGTLPDARISLSNVQQHQNSLVINADNTTTDVTTHTASFSVAAGDGESRECFSTSLR